MGWKIQKSEEENLLEREIRRYGWMYDPKSLKEMRRKLKEIRSSEKTGEST